MPKAIVKNSGMLDSWGRRNRKLPDYVCPECGKTFQPKRSGSKYCSNRCRWNNNGGWNKKPETWWINDRGYMEGRIWLPNGKKKTVKKHRLVMESIIGRPLLPTEDVHHVDGNRLNNDPSNLRLMTHGGHSDISNTNRVYKKGYTLNLTDEERANRSQRAIKSRFWTNSNAIRLARAAIAAAEGRG